MPRKAKPKDTLDSIADSILQLKLKEKDLSEQIEVLKLERAALEKKLFDAAEKEGLTRGGSKTSSWTVDVEVVPQVADWDAFYAYIKDNDYFHLLHRRPAVKACRELWEQSEAIPGVEKFSSPKINVRGV